MTTFHQQAIIDAPVGKVYAFLADCNHHEQLMPDSISEWVSTKDTAQFSVQKLAKLTLKVAERAENQYILFEPSEKAPFDVKLRWQVDRVDDQRSKVTLHVDAELNMMLKMMVSGPLQKLVDHQVHALAGLTW